MKHPGWKDDVEALGLQLSDQQWAELEGFEDKLRTVAIPRGMIAPGDADRLWERHLLDGLRGAADIPDGATVADLGSGAGIPGIPIAIARPHAAMTLIEPRRGRVAFLEAVAADLRLANVTAILGRGQDVRDRFDVVVARALASCEETWRLAQPLLRAGGRAIYWAGRGFDVTQITLEGVSCRVSTPSGLADEGPLVIMAQQ